LFGRTAHQNFSGLASPIHFHPPVKLLSVYHTYCLDFVNLPLDFFSLLLLILTFPIICITVQMNFTQVDKFEVKVEGGTIHEEFAKSTENRFQISGGTLQTS
jgi:hypothetical protein